MLVWEDKLLYSLPTDPRRKRKVEEKIIIETDISKRNKETLVAPSTIWN